MKMSLGGEKKEKSKAEQATEEIDAKVYTFEEDTAIRELENLSSTCSSCRGKGDWKEIPVS